MSRLIPLFVVLPLAAAFMIPVLGRYFRVFQKLISNLVFLCLTILSAWFLLDQDTSALSYQIGGWEAVQGIPIAIYFVLDGLSIFILTIINTMALMAAIYSISYLERYTAPNNFFTLLCLMVAGMNGAVLSGDLFNLFVFLEISVIASYALVAFGVEKQELEASFKYQVLGGIASLLILLGITLVYWKTKTLNMADVASILRYSNDRSFMVFTQLILIAGFGLKAALIPFHAWLPDAHSSAPSPISAMLSGVLIKAIGIYALFRLFFNVFSLSMEISVAITVLGVISMVLGSLLAINQWDIKRMFAFSSISQVGYIVTGLGMGMIVLSRGGKPEVAALAITGALFHLVNHASFKGLLFLNAGAIEQETYTRDLRQMGGLAKCMPVTAATSLGGSLAISGIPPFNGFFSKLIIIVAAVQGKFYLIAFLAVLISIITLAYFLKFQRFAFFNRSGVIDRLKIREVPFSMCFSMVFLALMCLVLSLLIFPGIRELVLSPAVDALMNANEYKELIIAF